MISASTHFRGKRAANRRQQAIELKRMFDDLEPITRAERFAIWRALRNQSDQSPKFISRLTGVSLARTRAVIELFARQEMRTQAVDEEFH